MKQKHDTFKELTEKVRLCLPPTFTLFDQGDRHGSREWTWWNGVMGGIARFVTLAVIPSTGSPRYAVELWVGAQLESASDATEAPSRYTRERLARVEADTVGELMDKPLYEAAKAAGRKAESLSAGDLHQPGMGRLGLDPVGALPETV